MNVLNMIAAEREQIEHAILTLERIARGGAKRRGRPPKWMSDQNSAEPSAAVVLPEPNCPQLREKPNPNYEEILGRQAQEAKLNRASTQSPARINFGNSPQQR